MWSCKKIVTEKKMDVIIIVIMIIILGKRAIGNPKPVNWIHLQAK